MVGRVGGGRRLSKNTARDRIVVYNIFCINGRRRRRPGDVAKCVAYRMLPCGRGRRTERWFGAQVFHLRDSLQTTPPPLPPPPGRGSRPPLCHCHYITRTRPTQWEWCETTAAARRVFCRYWRKTPINQGLTLILHYIMCKALKCLIIIW